MGRDFDGTNDRLDFGSDASIDDYPAMTMCAWVRPDSAATDDLILGKPGAAAGGPNFYCGNTRLRFYRPHATTDGDWNSGAGSLPTGALRHVAVTYDRGSVANDPIFYVDGVAQVTTEVAAPVGAVDADAASVLFSGEAGGGFNDLNGLLAHLVYHDAVLSAAEINRARFWGSPRGGPSTVKMWHPLWTNDLANRGTAVAPGAATGTVMDNASCPRVERMWGSLMGVGR